MALGIVDKCNSQSVSLNDWVKLITTGMIISWNILQYLQSSLCLPILSLNTEAFSINLYFSACSFIAFHDSRQRLPLFDSSSIFKASGQFSLNLSKRIRLAASDKFLIAPWGQNCMVCYYWPIYFIINKDISDSISFKYNPQHTKRTFSVWNPLIPMKRSSSFRLRSCNSLAIQ